MLNILGISEILHLFRFFLFNNWRNFFYLLFAISSLCEFSKTVSIWGWEHRLIRFWESFFIVILMLKSIVSKVKLSWAFCFFYFYPFVIMFFLFWVWFFKVSIFLRRLLMSRIFDDHLNWLSFVFQVLFLSIFLPFKLFLLQFSHFFQFLSSLICKCPINCIRHKSLFLI